MYTKEGNFDTINEKKNILQKYIEIYIEHIFNIYDGHDKKIKQVT